MPINPYFRSNYYGKADQSLLETLIIESIKIHGHDVYYVPRTLVAFDKLYGEDKLSAFEKAIPIEVYLLTTNQFEGDRDLISQFGLEIRDEIRLSVSKKRFKDEITRKIPDIVRAREGDLIYIPVDDSLFEISFVEDIEAFYQLGNLYTYAMTCKRFEMGSESFNTGIEVVDSVESSFGALTEIVFDEVVGNFMVSERVYQGTNLVDSTWRAEVVQWMPQTKTLTVAKTFGSLDKSKQVIGNDSIAVGEYNVDRGVVANINDRRVDNEELYDESQDIIDSTETNPTRW